MTPEHAVVNFCATQSREAGPIYTVAAYVTRLNTSFFYAGILHQKDVGM